MTKRPLKLLIVEDEPAILRLLTLSFQKAGFNAMSAADGLEGLSVARRIEPEIIVFDILMPRMDGLSMLKKIRGEGPWGKSIRAFAYSNLNQQKIRREANELGVEGFLIKAEVGIEQLIDRITG